MTVSSSTSRAPYSGNGSTVAFPIPFYFLASSHIRAILQSSDGSESELTNPTHYSVTGAGSGSGGTLTMVTAPAIGQTLVIERNVPATQASDFPPNDRLPAATVEDALDKLTMLAQQAMSGGVDRVLRLYAGDTDGSGRYNAGGNRISDLGDATDAADAATLGQVEELIAATAGTDSGIVPQEFDSTGDGITTTFTLGTTASWSASSGLLYEVFINGLRKRLTDDFTIGTSGANRTITFVSAPAMSAVIYVILRAYAQAEDTGANTLRADLASTTDLAKGAALISFPLTSAESAAGASPVDYTAAEARLSRYCAIDGSTDDSAALQAALDSLGTTGGTLWWDVKGTMKLASGIQWPKTPDGIGIRIAGLSPGASKILFTGTGYAITFGDGDVVNSTFFPSLTRLSIYGNGAAGQSGAVNLNSTYFWELDCVHIRDFTTANAHGVNAVAGKPNYHGKMRHCYVRNVPRGVSWDGTAGVGANSNLIEGSWFGVHSDCAIYLEDAASNVVLACEFNGGTTTAIKLKDAADGTKVVLCQFDGPTYWVEFVNVTPANTVIALNTGGGSINGRGTRTLYIDSTGTRILSSAGLIVGDANLVASNAVPLTVVEPTGLSTYAFVVQSSAGQYHLRLNNGGALEVYQNLTTHGGTSLGNDVSNNSVVATITNVGANAANVGLVLKGAAAQTGDILQVQNSAGTVLALITASGRIHLGATTAAPGIMSGTGTPEGAVAAPIGSLFLRTDGGAGTSLYVKESGTGNTGWVGK